MVYWFYNENRGLYEWQLNVIKDKARIGHTKTMSNSEWENIRNLAGEAGVPIINNPETNMPMLGQAYQPSEAEVLRMELEDLKYWIESQAYIVTLIGAGVATAEEYHSELEEMRQKKERIKEINTRLAEINI